MSNCTKENSFKPLIIPVATVFVSSACIMMLEMVASRVVSRHLGASIYTWTSVIGVVLAGITMGNYIGGRIADKFQPKKALASIFSIAAFSCVAILVLINTLFDTFCFIRFAWSLQVFLYVATIFLIPSTILGMISPVAAKMALEKGLPTGRTVGDIYAWGAAGSITGTFLAGFYLIAAIGTCNLVWVVTAILVAICFLYAIKSVPIQILNLILVLLIVLGTSPWDWTNSLATTLRLKKVPDETIIYENETPYCYVAVQSLGGDPEKRAFLQDILIHSAMYVGEIENLNYSYAKIMAAFTHHSTEKDDEISTLTIGGGGYVFPRYIEKLWPKSTVDVVEIDPGVTEAAMAAFGLERDTTINTITLDARNYIDMLIDQENMGGKAVRYDFIYEDAINDYTVPFQLITKEFNEKILRLLTDDGMYMVNMIDLWKSGLFVGSFINTLEETFPYVGLITESSLSDNARTTFVAVAAKKPIDIETVCKNYKEQTPIRPLTEKELAGLAEKSKGLILTDDYAPVENLLAPVVRQSGIDLRERLQIKARKIAEQAEKAAWKGDLPATLKKLKKLEKTEPTVALRAHKVMSLIFLQIGKPDEAFNIFEITLDKYKDNKSQLADVHYEYGIALKKNGKMQEGMQQLLLSVDGYKELLAQNPTSVKTCLQLGNILAESGDMKEAITYFKQAAAIQPGSYDIRFNLIRAFVAISEFDEAIGETQKAIEYMSKEDRLQDAQQLTEFKKYLIYKKNQPKQ